MRKFITALLALVMVSVMSVSASAAAVDQDSDSKSADTAIKTSIAPSYTVTIPADTIIDFNACLLYTSPSPRDTR